MVLEMRGITKTYPGVTALEDVSLHVAQGEVHAVVGENGAGKSTLMNILAGAVRKDKGTITISGREVAIHCVQDARNNGISGAGPWQPVLADGCGRRQRCLC